MAPTISNVYIETFETNVRYLAQQSDTRLRPHVREVNVSSEKHNWERVGSTTAVQKTGVLVNTPVSETPWSRRVSVAEVWHDGDAVEQEDLVQMLIEPKSTLAQTLAMSMRRAADDLIIAAASSTALAGDGSTPALPAAQIKGDGTTKITLELVLQVNQAFLDNDVDPDEPKVFVIGPKQQTELMQLMEVTSGDYQNAKALANGVLPSWMGFTWIVSNRLTIPAANQLYCLAFTPRGIGLQVNKDITAKVAEDPTKSFVWRIYTYMVMGAVRVEDEHVVLCHVATNL